MKKLLILLSLCFMLYFPTEAADVSETVNVTVPAELSVVFEADGTESISEFCISNQSVVPVTICNIRVTEYHGWELVPRETQIPANTTQIALCLGEQCLQAGDNPVNIFIPEHTEQQLDIKIIRGAWTTSASEQVAFHMEFEYAVGQKEFRLSFDANGADQSVETVGVCNGDTIALPQPTRAGYDFKGWKDEEGNLYTTSYTMPIGAVTLTAQWAKKTIYAVYSADDNSFIFYHTSQNITAGSTYNGKTVTNVYQNFSDQLYTTSSRPPWKSIASNVKKVIVADTISPTYTSCWFLAFENCTYMDLGKLDMSHVLDISYMLNQVGYEASTLEIHGLSTWNVSAVTNMRAVFNGTGKKVTTFYLDDITGWDVSSVTDMHSFLNNTAPNAPWSVNLSGWNVKSVTEYRRFCPGVESKVIQPKWVN